MCFFFYMIQENFLKLYISSKSEINNLLNVIMIQKANTKSRVHGNTDPRQKRR
jgi:hypothetical protein